MTEFLEQEHSGLSDIKSPSRIALVLAYVNKIYHQLKVDLDRASIITKQSLPDRISRVDATHSRQAAEACLADERVKEKLAQLKLPQEAVVIAEPWTYATDGMNDMTIRITMVLTRLPVR